MNCLSRRNVRQCGCGDQIANSIDTLDGRLIVLIDLDFVALQFDTDLLQADVFGVGFDTDSRQNHICNECLSTLLALDIDLAATLVIDASGLYGCARIDRCAHLAEGTLHRFRDLLVFERHKVGQILHNGNLHAQLCKQKGKFATDRTRADHYD